MKVIINTICLACGTPFYSEEKETLCVKHRPKYNPIQVIGIVMIAEIVLLIVVWAWLSGV